MTRSGSRAHVTPHYVAREPDLVSAARHDPLIAQRVAQDVQRLAQCSAGMGLVQLGPVQREQRVASMEATRDSGRQIDKEGRTLRLAGERFEVSSVRRVELEGPKNPELDHSTALRDEPLIGL